MAESEGIHLACSSAQFDSPSGEFGLAPAAGMGAGGNTLVVPAGNHLVCYR